MTKAPAAPPDGLRPPGGRSRDEDRLTRKPLTFWDRVKFLLLLAVIWSVLLWATMAGNQLISFADGFRMEIRSGSWLLVLMLAEAIRQAHYLISEHSAAYYRFWKYAVFGGFDRFMRRRMSDWTRFRLRRVLMWLFWIAVVAVAAGGITHKNPVVALFRLPVQLWHIAPIIVYVLALISLGIVQMAAMYWFLMRGGVDLYYPDDITTRFSDVWGQDHVLERVKENILYLETPEVIEERGGYVPGGILLWGPPGTGKTLMAEAVAGETGMPYVFVDPGAFVQMFMGIGVLKVKSLFRKLRKLALRYGGVIVFFDEADTLGSRGMLAQGGPGFPRGASPAPHRAGCHGFSYLSPEMQSLLFQRSMQAPADGEAAGQRNKQIVGVGGAFGGGALAGSGVLQALLTELSGLKKPRGLLNRHGRRALGMRPKPPPKYRILVMMASNLPEALDPALLRPGRIDRIYKVGYPSKDGRRRTYEGYLAKVPHELSAEQIEKLAVMTPYATGAMIKDTVNEALIRAIREDRDVITWPDMIRAKQLKELGPPEDVEYIERERHAVAVHEACHAVVAFRTRQHWDIDLATIEKGGDYLGMVTNVRPDDLFTHWRTEYEADILVSLASLAGERMFFGGDSSSGVSGDLESATTVASLMEGIWGMGSTVSSHVASRRLEVGSPGGVSPGGNAAEAEMRRALADRIEDNLTKLLERVEEILRDNRQQVLCLAHALETHKTITGDDVAAVLEHRRGPVIDGTAYGDPAFVRRLEEYHGAAALAHRDHSKVAVGLPAAVPAADALGPHPNGHEPNGQEPDGWVPDSWVPGSQTPGAEGEEPNGREPSAVVQEADGQEPGQEPEEPGPGPQGS